MRKFLFNTQLLGAIAGGWSVLQATRKGPRDWQLGLMWVAWGLGVAVAAGAVIKESQQAELEAAGFDLDWDDR
jgi:hypothetical protein